jgi:hypothetical protein
MNYYPQDHRLKCSEDIDYQSSMDTVSGYWNVPFNLQFFAPDMHISIEQHSVYGSMLNMCKLMTRGTNFNK